jgi:hypothetical protein
LTSSVSKRNKIILIVGLVLLLAMAAYDNTKYDSYLPKPDGIAYASYVADRNDKILAVRSCYLTHFNYENSSLVNS